MPSRPRLTIIEATVPTVGQSLVKPSVYLSPIAQPISNRPASTSTSQDMAFLLAVDASGRAALAHGLEQRDAGGHGHVEAFGRAGHGDLHQAVAGFAREPAQPVRLAAQHDRDVAGEVERVQRRVRIAGEPVDPDAELLQVAQA